jgi:hypothetical protein
MSSEFLSHMHANLKAVDDLYKALPRSKQKEFLKLLEDISLLKR